MTYQGFAFVMHARLIISQIFTRTEKIRIKFRGEKINGSPIQFSNDYILPVQLGSRLAQSGLKQLVIDLRLERLGQK